ncbi:hypothetical protein PG291_06305 [Riemerella anatipestifer]|nr:hypothetical protein [Riemerella anatipestifer]MDY3548206.1 hypothetical protein [Riemerella anatipestifer]
MEVRKVGFGGMIGASGCVRDRSGYPTATERWHRAWAVARSNSG